MPEPDADAPGEPRADTRGVGWHWRTDDSTLYLGDSLDVMASWPDACVDSIVTSPEYADEVLASARDMGWKLLHRMVWHKKNPLPLSHPEYLTIAHEWVFWLAPTTKVYRGYDGDTRTQHAAATVRRIDEPYMRSKDERYAKRGKANALHPDGARPTTVFSCAVGSRRGINHPAPMALDLAKHLVSLSTPPGGVVLDPFCGSATTLVAARARGRLGVGIDLSAAYIGEAVRLLSDYAPTGEPITLPRGAA